uniref:Superoxide dismutase n=1 Tax=Heterorhabditis bacteriophora TaxID=37862 RepID=A0A1I7XMH7_HETBA
MTGLPRGDHAVVIHQFGDVGDGCTRIGPPFRGALRPPTLGDIYGMFTFPRSLNLYVFFLIIILSGSQVRSGLFDRKDLLLVELLDSLREHGNDHIG